VFFCRQMLDNFLDHFLPYRHLSQIAFSSVDLWVFIVFGKGSF